MPRTDCPEHGRSFMVSVCRHVAAAVDEDRSIQVHTTDVELAFGTVGFCDECAPVYASILPDDEDGLCDFLDARVSVVCISHFEEWVLRHTILDCLDPSR
jgi:hypothetical protein